MTVLSTLGVEDGYMQYALLAAITGVVFINLKSLPFVWHVSRKFFLRRCYWLTGTFSCL